MRKNGGSTEYDVTITERTPPLIPEGLAAGITEKYRK
jgi:hypothetical protein